MLKRLKNKLSSTDSGSVHTTIDTNAKTPLRWGLLVLFFGFGGFVLWAAFAPLDAGVTAEASVQVFGNRKAVQHLEGGTVDEILVREGDRVEEGQVLIRLNRTRAVSEQAVTSAQYIVAKVMEARLVAERDGDDEIHYAPELLASYGNDPRFLDAKKVQEQLFLTRRSALKGEVEILQENLRGAEQQLRGLEEVQKSRRSQIAFANQELEGVRELAKEGYLPRNRMLNLERDAAQLQAALSNDVVEAGRTRNQIAELKLRILQRQQDFQKEVQTQLSDIQKETSSLAERLASLDYTVRETEIRAPIEGFVQDVTVHTIGGVIGQGAKLMEIVPEDQRFIIQAQIPVFSIDKVEPGLEVEITFPAFNHARTPNIPGKVQTLSSDRLTDEKTGMPYYLAQIEVTPEGMELLRYNNVRPGMPAAVLIRTGERTMMSYILKPFLERLDKSFTED